MEFDLNEDEAECEGRHHGPNVSKIMQFNHQGNSTSEDDHTEQALLEKAIEAENAFENMKSRGRTQSHFVDSKNEHMLLEDIGPDDEKSLGEMLLLDNEEVDDDDLLI